MVSPFNKFNYIIINVNNTNFMHEEITLRLKTANKAYFAKVSLLNYCRLLSRNTKEKLYSTYLRPK